MKIMKVIQFFLNKIIAPLVVGLLLFLITGVLSQINTGNYWRFFARIPLTVWIIIGLIILIWIMIIVYRKKLMRLESKISKFETASKVKPIVRNNAYWLPNKDGTEDGPFCTKCWDKNKHLIRLNNWGDAGQCPECKNIYRFGRGSDEKFPDDVGGDTW